MSKTSYLQIIKRITNAQIPLPPLFNLQCLIGLLSIMLLFPTNSVEAQNKARKSFSKQSNTSYKKKLHTPRELKIDQPLKNAFGQLSRSSKSSLSAKENRNEDNKGEIGRVLIDHLESQYQDITFRILTQSQDKKGNYHFRLQQLYKGIPVSNGVTTIHINKKMKIYSVSGKIDENLNLQTDVEIPFDLIESSVHEFFAPQAINIREGSLTILDGKLAYETKVTLQGIHDFYYITVDINAGEILSSYSGIDHQACPLEPQPTNCNGQNQGRVISSPHAPGAQVCVNIGNPPSSYDEYYWYNRQIWTHERTGLDFNQNVPKYYELYEWWEHFYKELELVKTGQCSGSYSFWVTRLPAYPTNFFNTPNYQNITGYVVDHEYDGSGPVSLRTWQDPSNPNHYYLISNEPGYNYRIGQFNVSDDDFGIDGPTPIQHHWALNTSGSDFGQNHKEAISVARNISYCQKFIKNRFDRDSWDDRGTPSIVNMFPHHDKGAGWNGLRISIGDPEDDANTTREFEGVLDIMAHEFAHGITMTTSNVRSTLESGALNESFSDIFCVWVEHEYQEPGTNQGQADWMNGEDSTINYWGNSFVRDLAHPWINNDERHTGGPSLYKGNNWDDIYHSQHFNGMVQSYLAYLLSTGLDSPLKNHGSNHVMGPFKPLGLEATASIAWQANMHHLVKDSQYRDSRNAWMIAAKELGYDANTVAEAWAAVGVVDITSGVDPYGEYLPAATQFSDINAALYYSYDDDLIYCYGLNLSSNLTTSSDRTLVIRGDIDLNNKILSTPDDSSLITVSAGSTITSGDAVLLRRNGNQGFSGKALYPSFSQALSAASADETLELFTDITSSGHVDLSTKNLGIMLPTGSLRVTGSSSQIFLSSQEFSQDTNIWALVDSQNRVTGLYSSEAEAVTNANSDEIATTLLDRKRSNAQVIPLFNGQSYVNLTNDYGAQLFSFHVPEGAESARIELISGSGSVEADLYVKKGGLPTFEDYDQALFNAASPSTIYLTEPGNHQIMVWTGSGFTSHELAGTYDYPDMAVTQIGSALSGTLSYSEPGIVHLSGSGLGLAGTSDDVSFAYKQVAGDGILVTRIDSLSGTGPERRPGLMLRDTLDTDSKHFSVLVGYNWGADIKYRDTTGGNTSEIIGIDWIKWVKLVKEGNQLSAYAAPDGTGGLPTDTWILLGEEHINLGSTFYVGTIMNTGHTSTPATSNMSGFDINFPGSIQQPADSPLVIEAENYFGIATAIDGNHSWEYVTSPSGYSGSGAVQVQPNIGFNHNPGHPEAPWMNYLVHFHEAGTYHLWGRGQANSSGDDSFHAIVDHYSSPTSDKITGFNSASFKWSSATMGGPPATIDIDKPGEHILTVMMREDGLTLDKLLLSKNSSYTPSGSGPEQSLISPYGTFFAEDFEGSLDDFSYSDNMFRGTSASSLYAYNSAISGILALHLGGEDNDDITGMSGGWETQIFVEQPAHVILEFDYEMDMATAYEANEYCEVLVSVNGILKGTDGNDYVFRLYDGGNPGWQPTKVDLGFLSAGTHTLRFGAYNNKKTHHDEKAWVSFDNMTLTSGKLTYQAEDYTDQYGVDFKTDESGYKGHGYMDYFGEGGSFLQWDHVYAPSAGQYQISFRYTNGSGSNRTHSLYANGTSVGSESFSPTGSWSTWSEHVFLVNLLKGHNQLKFVQGSGSGVNVDQFSLTYLGDAAGGGPTSLYLEAEDAYVFTGYSIESDGSASAGQYLQTNASSSISSPGPDQATYSFNIAEAGGYKIWTRTSSVNGTEDSFWGRINGGTWIKRNNLTSTSSWEWDEFVDSDNGSNPVIVNLSIGTHTFEIANREKDLKIDKIYFTKDGDTPSN